MRRRAYLACLAGTLAGCSNQRDPGDRPDGTVAVGPGDSFTIPGDEPHAAENRGEAVVRGVDIFAPPRPDPDWAE